MSEPLSESPSEESFFDFNCPHCEEINSFPTASARTLQECASCGQMIIVPEAGGNKGGKLPLPISSARLLVRRFQSQDSRNLLKLVKQDEACALPITEMNVDEFIEQQREAVFTRGETGVYLAIELTETRELAGYILFYFSEPAHSNAGFNVTITPPRRRQGLGLEAARAALDFAFDGLCAHRVALSCPSRDAAARGLLEKLGMRQEGEFIKSWLDGKEWVDVRWYALLKEERKAN